MPAAPCFWPPHCTAMQPECCRRVPPRRRRRRARPNAAQIAHGKTLFISYGCGWCHEDGGRKAGKCPQLMDTQRDDESIISLIAVGSPGKMPAFGEALTEADIHALLLYIRSLKPESNP